jgi:hypothetical protein
MHLVATNRYLFKLPVSVQRGHLLDVGHLTRVHRLTLWGLKVADIRRLRLGSTAKVEFDLSRFGTRQRASIEQCLQTGATTVQLRHFRLCFCIEPRDSEQHWLDVRLYSTCRWHRWLQPLVKILFALTVLEDRWHYERRRKRRA